MTDRAAPKYIDQLKRNAERRKAQAQGKKIVDDKPRSEKVTLEAERKKGALCLDKKSLSKKEDKKKRSHASKGKKDERAAKRPRSDPRDGPATENLSEVQGETEERPRPESAPSSVRVAPDVNTGGEQQGDPPTSSRPVLEASTGNDAQNVGVSIETPPTPGFSNSLDMQGQNQAGEANSLNMPCDLEVGDDGRGLKTAREDDVIFPGRRVRAGTYKVDFHYEKDQALITDDDCCAEWLSQIRGTVGAMPSPNNLLEPEAYKELSRSFVQLAMSTNAYVRRCSIRSIELNQDLGNKQGELEEMKGELESTRGDLEAVKRQLALIQEELEVARSAPKGAEEALEEERKKNETLSRELQQTDNAYRRAKEAFEVAAAEKDKAKNELILSKREADNLRSTNHRLIDERKEERAAEEAERTRLRQSRAEAVKNAQVELVQKFAGRFAGIKHFLERKAAYDAVELQYVQAKGTLECMKYAIDEGGMIPEGIVETVEADVDNFKVELEKLTYKPLSPSFLELSDVPTPAPFAQLVTGPDTIPPYEDAQENRPSGS